MPAPSASASCSSVSTSISILTMWPTGGPRALDRRADAAGDRDVVVLDQHAVVEAEAVVAAAAGAHGVLLAARAGRASSCACRRCARRGAGDRLDEPGGGRGDAARGGTRKLSATRSAVSMPRAGPSSVAIALAGRDRGAVAARPRSATAGSSRRKASRAQRRGRRRRRPGAATMTPSQRASAGHDGVGGDVAGAAEILGQGGADERLDEQRREGSIIELMRRSPWAGMGRIEAATASTSASVIRERCAERRHRFAESRGGNDRHGSRARCSAAAAISRPAERTVGRRIAGERAGSARGPRARAPAVAHDADRVLHDRGAPPSSIGAAGARRPVSTAAGSRSAGCPAGRRSPRAQTTASSSELLASRLAPCTPVAGDLAAGPKSRHGLRAARIHHDAAHMVVGRRAHRDRLSAGSIPAARQRAVTVGKRIAKRSPRASRHRGKRSRPPRSLRDGAGHDIARRPARRRVQPAMKRRPRPSTSIAPLRRASPRSPTAWGRCPAPWPWGETGRTRDHAGRRRPVRP